MDLNQLYNRLGVDRRLSVKCTQNQVPTIRNAIHKKQSLLNGLVGREFTLKSRYDQSAGILHFWYVPATPEFNFEIVEDNHGSEIRGDVDSDSKERNGHDSLPSFSSQDTGEGDATGSMAPTESSGSCGIAKLRQDEDNKGASGGDTQDADSV